MNGSPKLQISSDPDESLLVDGRSLDNRNYYFHGDASFESVTDIFNIISPFFIFIILVCRPSEKIVSRIIIPKKINRHQHGHQLASDKESCAIQTRMVTRLASVG
jgi:hypothetical protein